MEIFKMHTKLRLLFGLTTLLIGPCTAHAVDRDMVLWHNQPGETWYDAMLIGNGIMGARVFGGIQDERIALNEGTFWSGRPHDYANPEGSTYFPKIRDLVFAGRYHEADVMADEHFSGIPKNQQAFQPLGDLLLSFSGADDVTDYYRELDMEMGIAKVSYGDVGCYNEKGKIATPHIDRLAANGIRFKDWQKTLPAKPTGDVFSNLRD
jgi:alpha-L-fucosidase 2